MKLEILVHPNPYRASWLIKGPHLDMNELFLLNFQIGSLQQHILCDLIEMDASHILLGRPWMFDRNIYHDGHENTYEFKKDGQWYKLILMV